MKMLNAVCFCFLFGFPTLFFGQVNELIYTKNAHWSYLAFDGQPGIKLPGWYEYSGKDTFLTKYFISPNTVLHMMIPPNMLITNLMWVINGLGLTAALSP